MRTLLDAWVDDGKMSATKDNENMNTVEFSLIKSYPVYTRVLHVHISSALCHLNAGLGDLL